MAIIVGKWTRAPPNPRRHHTNMAASEIGGTLQKDVGTVSQDCYCTHGFDAARSVWVDAASKVDPTGGYPCQAMRKQNTPSTLRRT